MTSIRALKQELEELDKRREVVSRLIEAMLEYENLSDTKVGKPEVARAGANVFPSRIRFRNAPVMSMTYAVVRDMLNELNRPVQTQEILKRMEEKGITVSGENPANIVSARLSNSEEFEGKRGKGWWFANKPWPDEGDELL